MKNKYILSAATIISAIILYTKLAKAEPNGEIPEGEIVAVSTDVFGDCDANECIIGKELMIHSTFKNIGNYNKSNRIGILINNEVVTEKYVTLCPYQEYLLSHSLVLEEEKDYEICGMVFE